MVLGLILFRNYRRLQLLDRSYNWTEDTAHLAIAESEGHVILADYSVKEVSTSIRLSVLNQFFDGI